MVHLLKIKPEYFRAVDDGTKTFEVRKNDRDYRAKDYIVLREWDGQEYTGRMVYCRIKYLLTNPEYVADGYVIFSIDKVKLNHAIVKGLRQVPELLDTAKTHDNLSHKIDNIIRVSIYHHGTPNVNGFAEIWYNEYTILKWHGIKGAIRIALRKDRRREKTKPYKITAERSFVFYD